MELYNLKPATGSTKNGKRIARGQGSGRGGTSTRGHNGQKSRSGYSRKRNHEGGQMPLQMRLPKRGFNSPNRVEYVGINLDRLEAVSEKYNIKAINPETLIESGIVRKNDRVKILGGGEIKGKYEVKAHACTESAKKAIEAAGGSIELI
ncbi:MAG: large subunit ribosomal protein L15 [Saprospiraceae bacterium]|jgi:large subunit ribosomal protein L15